MDCINKVCFINKVIYDLIQMRRGEVIKQNFNLVSIFIHITKIYSDCGFVHLTLLSKLTQLAWLFFGIGKA